MGWKRGVRVLGFDDAPRVGGETEVPVVGAVLRGRYLEAVLRTDVGRDGDDATGRLAAAVNQYAGKPNVVAVLLQNLMVAGFNVIDMQALFEAIDVPVVAVMKGRPNVASIEAALKVNVAGGEEKWARYTRAGAGFSIAGGWAWSMGLSNEETRELLEHVTVRGGLPEAVRVAHLIGAGWKLGESKGS